MTAKVIGLEWLTIRRQQESRRSNCYSLPSQLFEGSTAWSFDDSLKRSSSVSSSPLHLKGGNHGFPDQQYQNHLDCRGRRVWHAGLTYQVQRWRQDHSVGKVCISRDHLFRCPVSCASDVAGSKGNSEA